MHVVKKFDIKPHVSNNLYPTKDSGLGIDIEHKKEQLQLNNKKI